MTAQTLRTRSLKFLADMARKHGVHGWNSMRKDQLVRALLQNESKPRAPISRSHERKLVATRSAPPAKTAAKKAGVPVRVSRTADQNGKAGVVKLNNHSAGSHSTISRNVAVAQNGNGAIARVAHPAAVQVKQAATSQPSRAATDPRVARKIEQAKVRLMRAKILATDVLDGRSGAPAKDRLVVMVRGPYWLHAYWEITPTGVVRAQAALGEQWHQAKPILRLIHVSSPSGSTSAERVLRDISIHGGVKNWYVDVLEPPQTYRMEIGYLAANGRFFSLARSNTVSTPSSGSSEKLDNHWTDVVENCDTIYAMSGGYSTESNSSELQEVLQERLRRTVGGSMSDRYQSGTESLLPKDRAVRFHVEAEMLIHGTTHPDAQVTLQGAPIKLRADGSFTVKLDLPNRRQVIPLVATSKEGTSQRTVVLAVERNTKTMEPVNHEPQP